MDQVIDCIDIAAADYGEHTFWIYPWDDDDRGAARLRLFQRYADLEPDDRNFGYILNI